MNSYCVWVQARLDFVTDSRGFLSHLSKQVFHTKAEFSRQPV